MTTQDKPIFIGYYAMRELKPERVEQALGSGHYTRFFYIEKGGVGEGEHGRYVDPAGLYLIFNGSHVLVKGSPLVLRSDSGAWYFALGDDWLVWR